MSYELTEFLGMQVPVVGSGEPWSSAIYRANLEAIDAKLAEHQGSIDAIALLDLDLLPAHYADFGDLPAAGTAGRNASVAASADTGRATDVQVYDNGSTWKISHPVIVFDTQAHLTTFVAARGAYLVAGQRFYVTETLREYIWLTGTTLRPTSIIAVEGDTPPTSMVAGQVWGSYPED